MKRQIVLFVCLVVALSAVYGQTGLKYTGQKCGVDNQQLYDRSLNLNTCNDYCQSSLGGNFHFGFCELHNGYGECKCGYF